MIKYVSQSTPPRPQNTIPYFTPCRARRVWGVRGLSSVGRLVGGGPEGGGVVVMMEEEEEEEEEEQEVREQNTELRGG